MSPFPLRGSGDLIALAQELGAPMPWSDELDRLFQPLEIRLPDGATLSLPNRLAVHPMEGFDAEPDGSPGELAHRRYLRYAEGGSGLIWFEATAVVPEGRSNPRQLLLTTGTVAGFERLVEATRRRAEATFGGTHRPLLVLQLTHSGRFSRPEGLPVPRAGALNPHLDGRFPQVEILTDPELDRLIETFIAAAGLAARAGFDAVDIKACHGYLLHDLLSAFTRIESRYGGPDLADRSRFMQQVFAGVSRASSGSEPALATRLSLTDGLPRPWGFGTDGAGAPDLTEPHQLLRILTAAGCRLLNVTAGVPQLFPWLGRPYDRPAGGDGSAPEHPLTGVARLLELAGEVTHTHPDLQVVATGFSWLRQFWPGVAAGVLAGGGAHLIGLGRSSFAYPEAPRDLMDGQALDPKKVCVACSRCTELMRALCTTGCAVHDPYYAALHRELTGRV